MRRLPRTSLLLCLLIASACSRPQPIEQPNILLITVDTLRADALACYGGEDEVGKTICSLADAGLRFRWAFSTAPHTAPATASLLTSQYPYAHRALQRAGSSLPDSAVTIAELLRDAGYQTGAVVSNPVLSLPGFDQGFQNYDDRMTRSELNRRSMEREAEATTDAALGWMRGTSPAPWFLWVHYQDPHGPYDPPGDQSIEDPPDGERLPVLDDPFGLEGIPNYQALPGLFTLEAYEELYKREIRYLDAHLERLLRFVEQRGDSPAIILTADHGEAFGEDAYYFAHGHSVGLAQLRVPLIYRPPGGTDPQVVEEPVSIVDVAVLIADLAGVERPAPFVGEPVLAEGLPREGPLFAEHPRTVAVIDGDAYFATGRGRTLAQRRQRRTRIAALPEDDDSLPAYTPAPRPRDNAALEALVARYLARARAAEAPAPLRPVSEQRRKQLEALGYVE